jgi:hypothetical protein
MIRIKQKTVLFIIVVLSIQTTMAALGTKFSYQGQITENNQLANGDYTMEVKFYDSQASGNFLLSNYFASTIVTNGLFTIELDIASLNFTLNQEVWLELSFIAPTAIDWEIMPRQLITNAPRAIHAQFVGENGVSSASIGDGAVFTEDLAYQAVTSDKIKDNTITSSDLANNSVDFNNLSNGAVITNKISDGSVTGSKIADNTIESIDILDFSIATIDLKLGAVTSDQIQNGTITGSDVALGAIGSANIQDGSINNIDIETGTITSAQLANDSVSSFEIRTGAVESAEILDNTIVAADIDSSSVQRRVSGTCSSGSSIRSISPDGSVTCETDDSGSSGWGLTGNSGTTAGTNFIGTTDNIDFIIKVNNTQALKFDATGNNVLLGQATNTVTPAINNSVISGGVDNSISTPGFITSFTTIGGGSNNIAGSNSFHVAYSTIAGGGNNTVEREAATVGGGKSNKAKGIFSTISGGLSNWASGKNSTVPGGKSNVAGGENSFAAGNTAYVRNEFDVGNGDTDGDEGTFVWSSSSTNFSSTGPKQFLIDSPGGVAIGTNTPKSPLHVKGVGTSNGSFDSATDVILTLENENASNNVALSMDRGAIDAESAILFSYNNSPEFDVRNEKSFGTTAISINHYDISNNNAKTTLMAFAKDNFNKRIDVNASIFPYIDDDIDNGSQFYRWRNTYSVNLFSDTLYTSTVNADNINSTNPVNVTSDRRLKDGILDLDYGLAEVLALRPVSYFLKKSNSDIQHLGLIAQEVETVIPEIVNKADDKKQTRSMRYGELVPVLIKATQEQQVIIDQQSKDIKRLESMVEKLLSHTESGK